MQIIKLLGLITLFIHLMGFAFILMTMPIPCDEFSLEKFKNRWSLLRTFIGKLLLKVAISFAVEKKFDVITIRSTGAVGFLAGLFFTVVMIIGFIDIYNGRL